MRKRSVSRSVLAVVLTLLLGFGILPPQQTWAAETVDMRVAYQLDGVSTVGKGMPFGAYFFFYLPGSYSPPDDAKVSVSSTGVSLSKKSFELQDYMDYPGDFGGEESGSSVAPSHFIYIPEQYMTNTGRSPAILKFTITWSLGSESYRAYAQKTITECTYEQGSAPEDPDQKSSLLLENYSVNKQDIREGDKFNLAITVKNNGDTACENVYVSLPSLDQITVDGKLNAQSTPTLAAGATATFNFPMVCASSMATGNVAIAIAVSSDEVQEKTTNAYVFVTGTAQDSGSSETPGDTPEMKPIVILESYDYGGEAVLGGKEFELTMNFKNTSRSQSIENAVIKVSAVTNDAGAGAAFTPANSSSTFYVESIAPGATAQEKITLLPKADAEPNSYSMQVTFDYVYGKDHTAASDSVTFSIPITQEDRFTVTLGEIYGPVMLGDSVYLSANYVNQGKSTIYNLSVEASGNFTALDGSSSYIGNVESGTGDYLDMSISPNEVGTMEGTLTFTYEDSTGQQKTKELTFTCDVMENMYIDPGFDPGIDPGMDPGMTEESSFPVWGIVLICVAGAGVIALLVVVIRKKRRAKRRRLLEELEDEASEELPFPELQPPLPSPGEEEPKK